MKYLGKLSLHDVMSHLIVFITALVIFIVIVLLNCHLPIDLILLGYSPLL